jgi:serine carboxypeptidase-like clade 2
MNNDLCGQIGNAVLNDETDQLGMVEYAWSHAIISDELHSAVTRECDSFKEEADGGKPGRGCSPAVRAFMGAFDDIDMYSIYTPKCLTASTISPAAPRPSRLVAAPRLFSQHVRVCAYSLTLMKRAVRVKY